MFKKFFDRISADRQADRRMFLEILDGVTRANEKQTELQIEQAKVFQGLLKMFDYQGTPTGWVVNEEEQMLKDLEQRKEYEKKLLDLSGDM